MKKRKLYKKLLILLVLIYAIFTLVNQQKVINQYTSNSKELASKMAREKLDMYYPHEKVYVDKGM